MCHYVTAVLPPGVDPAPVAAALAPAGMTLTFLPTHQVTGLLPGEQWATTTRGHCDCGTLIGGAHHVGRFDVGERELTKLRKKGWSQARIERWAAEKNKARDKQERTGPAPTLAQLVTALRAALAHTPSLGLLLHWYRGTLTEEPITIRARHELPAPTLTEADLHHLPEDTLLRICHRRPEAMGT